MGRIEWTKRLSVGLGLVAMAGCGAPSEEPASLPTSETSQPIYGGVVASGAEYDAVVGLHQRSGSQVSATPFCSGTLIAPDVVLTAAHCLDTARGGGNFKTMSPGAVAIYIGVQATTDPSPIVVGISENLIHPSYDRRRNLNDVALMRLDTAVPGAVASPIPALPSSLALSSGDLGATINFAGFGYTESGQIGVRMETDGTLAAFGCGVSGCPDSGDAATMISYSQPTAGPCSGDSGGPAFITKGGGRYVAGITSYGDSGCTIYGVSTRTDAFASFIDAFSAPPPPPPVCDADGACNPECAPGEDPDCAPDCSADGACNPECAPGEDPDCGGSGGSCGDGVCGAGESCDGRSGTIACGDCDGRTNGRPSSRYCYVEGVCEGSACP